MTPDLGPRDIFPYHNGTSQVWGDPHRIKRRLHAALGGDPAPIIARARDKTLPVEEWTTAAEQIIDAVRYAFDMPFDPATGKGALEKECLAALRAFYEHVESFPNRIGSRPTCAQPTGPQSSTGPGRSSGGCGSTSPG